jgi:catechol 2,3-dioxygenase-like lactoylglutathione lyase family enzyme
MSLATSAVSVMLPVDDIDSARTFYVEKLGLDHVGDTPDGGTAFALGGGATLVLLPRPDGTRNESTAMSWEVDDLPARVHELEERGVSFADYDLPGLRTEDHIATMEGERAAWFQDPAGNVLCVHERT